MPENFNPPATETSADKSAENNGETTTETTSTGEAGDGAGDTETNNTENGAKGYDDLDAANREITRLRRENAKDRTTARDTAAQEAKTSLISDISKALGLAGDGGETPTVDDLTAQLTESQDTARQANLELAVYRSASRNGADPDRLLDSRTFIDEASKLEAGDDYTKNVDALIKETVEKNSHLRATGQAPAKSGGEMTGAKDLSKRTAEDIIKAQPRRRF